MNRYAHIGIGAAVLLLVLFGAARVFWRGAAQTQYLAAPVTKDTIVVSTTGTGQVSASNQIDLKSQVSAEILRIGVRDGQRVSAGTLILSLDTADAEKAVRDAQVNFQSAQLALQKLKEPADPLSVIQAQNALTQAQADLPKSYDDGFSAISSAFTDLPTAMTGLQDALYGTELNKGVQDNLSAYGDLIKNSDAAALTFRDDAAAKYAAARSAYSQALSDYQSATRLSGTSTIDALLKETYDTSKTVADAIKSMNDLLNLVKDNLTQRSLVVPALLATQQTSLATWTNNLNADLLNLSNIRNTITTSSLSIAADQQAVTKLLNGADPLDIASAELSVTQKQNALRDAQDALANYFIRAPFDGTISKINVKQFDTLLPSTVITTLITQQKLATISLNEVDAAKIKVGDKATLTFDAVDGLSISGKVSEIDTVGTVSQGVVTYNVQITMDTQDDRVKPGMSVNASVITDLKQDTLVVPSTAVKTTAAGATVQVLDAPTAPPRAVRVQTGLSNDTQTEITSGLAEGQQVVVRTVTAAASPAPQSAPPSLFGGGGFRGGGGAGR